MSGYPRSQVVHVPVRPRTPMTDEEREAQVRRVAARVKRTPAPGHPVAP